MQLVVESINGDNERYNCKIVLDYDNKNDTNIINGIFLDENLIGHEDIKNAEIIALSDTGMEYRIHTYKIIFDTGFVYPNKECEKFQVKVYWKAIKKREYLDKYISDTLEYKYKAYRINVCNPILRKQSKVVTLRINNINIETENNYQISTRVMFSIEYNTDAAEDEIDIIYKIRDTIYIFYGIDITRYYTDTYSVLINKYDKKEDNYIKTQYTYNPFNGIPSYDFMMYLINNNCNKINIDEEDITVIKQVIKEYKNGDIEDNFIKLAILNFIRQYIDEKCREIVEENNITKYSYNRDDYDIKASTEKQIRDNKWSGILSFAKEINYGLIKHIPHILELRNNNTHNTRQDNIDDKDIRIMINILFLYAIYKNKNNEESIFELFKKDLLRPNTI